MMEWKRPVTALTKDEIMAAIADPRWQRFRVSLKGEPTPHKLEMLEDYLVAYWSRTAQIRVDNYINALLRGGQLVHRDGSIFVQR